jgi:uncharacterized membrane protein
MATLLAEDERLPLYGAIVCVNVGQMEERVLGRLLRRVWLLACVSDIRNEAVISKLGFLPAWVEIHWRSKVSITLHTKNVTTVRAGCTISSLPILTNRPPHGRISRV